MKISVIIYSNDDETIWNGFRFGVTSLIYDNETTVFLLGKGVEALSENSLYDIQEQVDLFRENGGTLIGCGVCVESRKDEMPNLEELLSCNLGSMQDLYKLVIEADKVLTF
ncbi:MAG: DsrE family protein [Gammaproteobacteria bacterium]|nr:DsrE family protein [Gammaproteobacteria bacterium]